MQEEVYMIKLSSGEEILGLIHETTAYVYVTKPMVVINTEDGYKLYPYAITTEAWGSSGEPLSLNKNFIMFRSKLREENASNYLQASGINKIQTTSKSVILPQ